MWALYISLCVVACIFLIVFLGALWGRPRNINVKSLGLPEGSVRALMAFLIILGFICFIFFGRAAYTTTEKTEDVYGEIHETEVVDTDLYNGILIAFATLTGSVLGFYFATRKTQQEASPPAVRYPSAVGYHPAGGASRQVVWGRGGWEEELPSQEEVTKPAGVKNKNNTIKRD